MSRSTPRKSRHRHQPSASGPRPVAAVSDYESDAAAAAQYLDTTSSLPPPPNPNPPRDNTELSLRVLRRYQPSIRSILAIAANAVAYTFHESTQGWDKHGAEGTMFVCDLEPIVVQAGGAGGGGQVLLPRTSVFVLNRRSMDNLVVDLLRVTDCEVVGELIVFRLEDNGAGGGNGTQDEEAGAGRDKKVLGLWIHADETNTREMHSSLILGAWQQGRQALEAYIQTATAEAAGDSAPSVGVQMESTGRSDSAAGAGRHLNVADLFGQKNGV